MKILFFLLTVPALAAPPVRTITAFVAVQPANAETRLVQAAKFLKSAKAEFERRGLVVQTIRVATTPLGADRDLLERLDALSRQEGFALSIGPIPPEQWKTAAEAFARTRSFNASMRLEEKGAATAAAELMRALSTQVPDGSQNFRFAAIAGLGPGSPFFPGGYASPAMDHSFAVGGELAGVVRDGGDLAAALRPLVDAAEAVARSSSWKYLGLDTSPAPQPGNSIGAALEKRAGSPIGSPGTLRAAASITAEIKAVPFRQTGYSGLMLPVLEDEVLAARAAEGRVSLHSLLLYSAVCGTGLDTVPIAGDTPVSVVAEILEEVALLARRWNKPLTARLFLVPGKKAGDEVRWDRPFLVKAFRVMEVGK